MMSISSTVNRLSVYSQFPITGKCISAICFWIFPEIFKRCKNLKYRSRCIFSLCGTIIQNSAPLTIYCIPVLFDRVWIIIRFGYHGNNFSGSRLHNNHRTIITAKCIICTLLDLCVKRGYYIISLAFCSRDIIFDLRKEEFM